MFFGVIDNIVGIWEENRIIEKDDRDVYVYGLDIFMSTILNALSVITTAALCGKLKETLVLLCVVCPLQAFCGGYHADTHLRCFLIMFIGWWAVMPLINFITPGTAMAIALISIVVIYIFAPVPHANAPMGEKRRRKMRMLGRFIGTAIVVFTFTLLFVFSRHAYTGIIMAAGLGVISFSMLCAWVKALCSG